MKIVYTYRDFSHRGGLERILCQKASALADAGHEVHIVCSFNDSQRPMVYNVSPGVRIHNLRVELNHCGSIWSLPFHWAKYRMAMHRALRRVYAEIGADISIFTPIWIHPLMYRSGRRTILESHVSSTNRTAPDTRYQRRMLRETHEAERRVDAIVALTREDAAGWNGRKPALVIPNFTDIQPWPRQSDGSIRACAVGRLHEQKDFGLLIDAWAIVAPRFPHAALDIYGEGGERAQLQQQIDSLGLTECITLKGNSFEMHRVYAAHDFLVMSSRREGMPLVLIEAMRCGCPCVSVDCPSGPADIITDGEDGLLVPYRGLPRDTQARNLAEAICRLLSDPAMLASFSERAQQNVMRFDKAEIIAQWEALFKQLSAV